MELRISSGSLEDHINAICRKNLGSEIPKKICKSCIIIRPVLDIAIEKGYKVQSWVDSAYYIMQGYQRTDEDITLFVDDVNLSEFVARFCRSNIRQGIKICNRCPLIDYVSAVGKEKGYNSFNDYNVQKSD